MTALRRQPRIFMMDLLATVPYYTAYLSKSLLHDNVDLTVGSISYYLDPACFTSRNITLDPGLLNLVGRFNLPRVLRRILKLAEAVLNLAALTLRFLISPPDIIHVQFLPMLRSRLPIDRWFVEICRSRGSKIVLTVHDLLPHDTGEAHKAIYAHLYRSVDAIICHSDSILTRLTTEFAIPESKISVIPHGPFFYDLPPANDHALQSFALNPESTIVLWQGIIFPYKGIDLLLEAWQQVEALCPHACLVIAGTGAPELLDQIRTQVASLDLQRVRLHFRFISTEELVALYRRADIVVYPYRAITTSGALATGLALGKTIVATDLPVFRELLTDGQNALLVPPQQAAALASALTTLLQDPSLRDRLAKQVHSMRFGDESWLAIAQQTAAVYNRVLAAGTHQPDPTNLRK
ncbi:MAG TPA: glycosyltransferase family 4 protein [Acidobacteriaceae bacterium]|nr:glycosyltransferase family 4 protein [Acidobacteriaceae bacterium]